MAYVAHAVVDPMIAEIIVDAQTGLGHEVARLLDDAGAEMDRALQAALHDHDHDHDHDHATEARPNPPSEAAGRSGDPDRACEHQRHRCSHQGGEQREDANRP